MGAVTVNVTVVGAEWYALVLSLNDLIFLNSFLKDLKCSDGYINNGAVRYTHRIIIWVPSVRVWAPFFAREHSIIVNEMHRVCAGNHCRHPNLAMCEGRGA